MADFEIRSKKVKNELQAWDTVRVQMERNREKVATIRNTLSLNSTAKRNIEMSLSKTADTLQKIINGSQAMKTALADSVMEYESTEQSLLQQKVLKDILEQKSDTPFQNFNENFWSNFWDSLRDALLEGTGNTIVKVGGLLNIATATARGVGNNAFVIVNPNVAKVTGKMFSAGNAIVTGAKYGLPVVGGIIDFFCLKGDGASNTDAAIKATAHVAIGWAGGEAGAAIGAAMGSVMPVAGTIVGAAVGFVAGVAITTIGNLTFDYVYDNWKTITEGVQEFGKQVVEGAGKAFRDIGQCLVSGWNGLGAVFG